MIHHISIGVSDIIASSSFYDAILQPLGCKKVFEDLHPGAKNPAIDYGVVPDEDIFRYEGAKLGISFFRPWISSYLLCAIKGVDRHVA